MKTEVPGDNRGRVDSTYSNIDPCTSLEGTKSDISIRNTPRRYNKKIPEVAQIQEHYGGIGVYKPTRRDMRQWKDGHFKKSRNVSAEI
jgi:hypothetical protein